MSSLRSARQRKEYLYRKATEEKAEKLRDKKRRLRDALENGTLLDGDLRGKEGLKLRKTLDLEDDLTKEKANFDDEYAMLGTQDPKVICPLFIVDSIPKTLYPLYLIGHSHHGQRPILPTLHLR